MSHSVKLRRAGAVSGDGNWDLATDLQIIPELGFSLHSVLLGPTTSAMPIKRFC